MTKDRVQVNFWVEPDLKEQLEQRAQEEDRSLSAVIRQACRVYVLSQDISDVPENVVARMTGAAA